MAISKKTLFLQLALLALVFVGNSFAIRKNTASSMTELASNNSSDPYVKGICTAKDRCSGFCTMHIAQGCICYNNGTCVNGWVNKCADCMNDDVFAVLEGQECPAQYPFLCGQAPKSQFCTMIAMQSCVCKTDGTCSTQWATTCTGCARPDNLAVFQGQSCPVDKLQAASCDE